MSEPPRARLNLAALRLGLIGILAAIVGWGLLVGDPTEADRVAALGARIRCPVCQGESIVDSPAAYAQDLLAFVEDRVDQGWSDEQILDHLEQRFTGIRLDPAFTGAGLLLWLLPLVAVGLGVALVQRRIRKPTAQKPPDPEKVPSAHD